MLHVRYPTCRTHVIWSSGRYFWSSGSFQFGYRKDRSLEDAVALSLHHVLNFVDLKEPNYVRLLFIDSSPAFNTISPFKLHDKLMNSLKLSRSLCDRILDCLLLWTQQVKIGNRLSGTLVVNTGTPQG